MCLSNLNEKSQTSQPTTNFSSYISVRKNNCWCNPGDHSIKLTGTTASVKSQFIPYTDHYCVFSFRINITNLLLKQPKNRFQGQTTYMVSKLQTTSCNVSWCIYFYRCSTCFTRFLRPSSGAQNCTYSFRYCQTILMLAASVDEVVLPHPR